MSGICSICKKNEAGKTKKIIFRYKGFKFKILKLGTLCEECQKEEFIESFHEFNEYEKRKLVSLLDGKLNIDWELYIDKQRNQREETYSEEIAKGMTRILKALGILTIDSKDNWEIISTGSVFHNPWSNTCMLYFTREEDVRSYAKIKYSGAMYGWEIRQQKN